MKMVEKVARSLCAHEGCNPDKIVPSQDATNVFYGVGGSVKVVRHWAEPHPLWQHFENAANAAIDVLREPTEEMKSAGNPVRADQNMAIDVWEAMIDAALSE